MSSRPVPQATDRLVSSALDYAARSWRVFPVPPGYKKGYKKADDHGGRRWGCTVDPQEVTADWLRWPSANVGIACGPNSGLFVIEADTIEGHGVDGVGNLASLIAEHGGLPDTIEALSPSGSRHLYFAWPEGVNIRNSEGRIAPGVDVRGEGGMVVAPPSIKPGNPLPYRWTKPPGAFDFAQCPQWLLDLCGPAEGRKDAVTKTRSLRVIQSDQDEEVLAWLYMRPNNLSREDWVRLGLALKGHFGPRAFDGWLSFSNRYGGEVAHGEAERQWESANPDGRVTIATAVRLLRGAAISKSSPPPKLGLPCAASEGETTDSNEIPACSRPTIWVRAGELHLMADEAEAALIGGGAPLYVRGRLVRPVVDDVPASDCRRTKLTRLVEADGATLLDHLSRCAEWVKFDGRKKETVAADPPKDLASIILSRDGEWRFPQLAGVITAPTLRPDGTILSDAGYDQATGLLLMSLPGLPALRDRPTRADALEALQLLDGLLDEFPFVDQASRSVALSALITPVVRGALPAAPMHVMTAPVAGSGKSFIVDVASAMVCGQRAPVMAVGRQEDETEKRLIAALIAGQPIISIDNVNGQLGGDLLCQMIERPVVSVRPLGVSKLLRIESRATCFATGNNIQLVGDMTRRVVLCSLDPNMERPEMRVFRGDPYGAVLADRGRYIAAALTICRAYTLAGFPDLLPALASFEEWSRIVRSALVWLGRDDPIATMEVARADDPVTASLRTVFAAWSDAVGPKQLSAGELKVIAEERNPLGNLVRPDLQDGLRSVAENRRGDLCARELGKFLGRHKGRIVDGLKLEHSDNSHSKQKLWQIVRV
jgi:putative DNA primase/helicase